MQTFDGPGIDLLGESAMAGQGDHPVSGLEIADTGAHGKHIAGAFGAGRKGKVRFELILPLGDQDIGEIDPGAAHPNANFTFAGRG